ncbi:hypothetical protein GCM10025734_37150 [Kitasatospora paranensis]
MQQDRRAGGGVLRGQDFADRTVRHPVPSGHHLTRGRSHVDSSRPGQRTSPRARDRPRGRDGSDRHRPRPGGLPRRAVRGPGRVRRRPVAPGVKDGPRRGAVAPTDGRAGWRRYGAGWKLSKPVVRAAVLAAEFQSASADVHRSA